MSSNKKTKRRLEFNSEQMTSVLEGIRKSNISLSDIENAICLFEKLSEVLVQLNVPLPPIYSIQNSLSSNEWLLYNQLHRLRITSIALINCKNYTNLRKKPDRKASKRAHQKDTSSQSDKIYETKRLCVVNTSASSQPCNSTISGMGLMDICYICKKHCATYIPRHEFYPWMCLKCGDINYKKRNQIARLDNKVALVTGGRIKIGFEIVLKLLRCGASVIITTRFPNDAKKRFEAQEDFSVWENRLHIYKVDLRFIPHVERFCELILSNFKQLDILIQNAAQTIRRPTAYYKSLTDGEMITAPTYTKKETEITSSSNSVQILSSRELQICKETSQLLVHPEDFKYDKDPLLSQQHFPYGLTDQDGDQLDLRPTNTWITSLDTVKTEEMIEVTLVNYMSPYIMLQKLTPLMQQERKTKPNNWGFIVLVSAMEGKFSCNKTGKHPHTNAAKAALNMLVKTSAKYYKDMGILMNAVDTGWVTDEHPVGYKSRLISGLKPPLDSIDGAARVLDPVIQTVANHVEFPYYGKFLKDYKVAGW